MNTCSIPGCPNLKHPEDIVCTNHWRQAPKTLRDRVTEARQAMADFIVWANEQLGPLNKDQDHDRG